MFFYLVFMLTESSEPALIGEINAWSAAQHSASCERSISLHKNYVHEPVNLVADMHHSRGFYAEMDQG